MSSSPISSQSPIETATQALVNDHLPLRRPQYAAHVRGAAFRTLEWYEEHIMISYYKELTRRCHVTSAIWLHDGLWLPKEISPQLIYEAERAMLHQLQLDSCDPPFSVYVNSLQMLKLLYRLPMMSTWPQIPPPSHVPEGKETSKVSFSGRDPSDGTHKHQHRAMIPSRNAWPKGVEQPRYPSQVL